MRPGRVPTELRSELVLYREAKRFDAVAECDLHRVHSVGQIGYVEVKLLGAGLERNALGDDALSVQVVDLNYRITGFGRQVFSAWRSTWQQTQTLVNTVLEGAPQCTPIPRKLSVSTWTC